MNLDEYQAQALTTAVYTDWRDQLVCTTLGLTGESGEVAEKVKKVIRDRSWSFSEPDIQDIEKELGDVLWYLAVLSHTLGLSLDQVAARNLEKLRSRRDRGVLHGSGDHR